MGRPEVCVGAIVVDEGRLLLVQRGHDPGRGLWSVPGGRVELGETLSEAVERELLEETGIRGQCGPLVGWLERIGDDHHFVIFDFSVRVRPGSHPVAGDDAAAARFVPLEGVRSLPLAGGVEAFLVEHRILDEAGT